MQPIDEHSSSSIRRRGRGNLDRRDGPSLRLPCRRIERDRRSGRHRLHADPETWPLSARCGRKRQAVGERRPIPVQLAASGAGHAARCSPHAGSRGECERAGHGVPAARRSGAAGAGSGWDHRKLRRRSIGRRAAARRDRVRLGWAIGHASASERCAGSSRAKPERKMDRIFKAVRPIVSTLRHGRRA